MSAAEKLGWRRSFPPGGAPAAYFAGGFAAGSPGGGRRKVALLAQGCRIHRACRWIRNTLGGVCGPLQTTRRLVRAGRPGGGRCRVEHAAFLAPDGRSKRSRRLRSPQRRPMPQRAVKGQGPFDISERRPSPYRAQRGRPLTAAARAKQHISERRPREYRAQRGRPLTAAARAKQLFSAKTVDKAKRWCYHSCKQRRRRQSRYESSTHGPQLRLLLYL